VRTTGKLVVRQGGEAEVVPPRQRAVAGAGGSGRRSRRVEAVVRRRTMVRRTHTEDDGSAELT
jgi:hypothetical protein